MEIHFKIAGDSSILIEAGEIITEETNRRLVNLAHLIEERGKELFVEVILGYCSLLVQYDPLKLPYKKAIKNLQQLYEESEAAPIAIKRQIEIPVMYGGEFGPDIESVAGHNGITPEDVISLHSGAEYLVYFLGFTPGYPFMGGMPEAIATPRLDSPRISIPRGSVGIANKQTGIYPVESPGGWRLIGRTPLRLYDAHAAEPFLLKAGDLVTFKSVEIFEFLDIEERINAGKYKPA